MRYGNITGRDFLVTEEKERALVNTYYSDDTAWMLAKNSGKRFVLSAPAEVCSRGNEHDNLSCSSCHTSWAPSCIGCHNEYDPEEPGYNMYTNKTKTGSWVEYIGEFNAHPPALGMRLDDDKKEVIPVIPGMIMTIDISGFNKELHDSLIFQRLFAPAAPHTTATEGRDCKSCHNNPVALGYGDGDLRYDVSKGKGRWIFSSKYAVNPNDGLPEDAWIGFLGERKGKVSTRLNVLPFTIEEQKRILTVGACLNCHEQDSKLMEQSLTDFSKLVLQCSESCILPEWTRITADR
jgi:hypothetical protein